MAFVVLRGEGAKIVEAAAGAIKKASAHISPVGKTWKAFWQLRIDQIIKYLVFCYVFFPEILSLASVPNLGYFKIWSLHAC